MSAGPWGVCSAQCNSGTQQRALVCLQTATGSQLPMSECADAGVPMLVSERPCNTQACAEGLAVWSIESQGPCEPAVCGGSRTQQIGCRCAA